MAYSSITFAQLKTQLANRLDDASKVFWTDTELGLYIVEAIRTWSALTAFYRARMTFPTVASTPFYDLTTQTTSPTTSPRAQSVTDRNLIQVMQYQLLEPDSPAAWTGTDMFTLGQLSSALQRRRDQFLAETGCFLTHSTFVAAASANGRYSLATTNQVIRRLQWLSLDSTYTNLHAEDEFAANAYYGNNPASAWFNPTAPPASYSVLAPPPLTLQLIPPPADTGTVDMISIQTGATLAPATSATALGIPDDLCWGVKWGALADLLSMNGQALDPQRAAYCESMWKLSLAAARFMPIVINGQINGVDLISSDLYQMDALNEGWQGTSGTPSVIASAANLIALGGDLTPGSGIPDGVYSVTLDVVSNATVPSVDGDFIQIGNDQLDTLLDYAEHLAAFKRGGAEFASTLPLRANFLAAATVYSNRLSAQARYNFGASAQSWTELADRSLTRPGTLIAGVA